MIRKLLSSIPFINNYYSGIATIFYLHRVDYIDSNKLFPNENMKVSPEFLESFIVELKSKGYEFISLNRLYEILQNGERVKKQIVFTLDDGYKDNYEIAYPIFKKHNVPFTIYITTSFPQNEAILWWYVLEDLILSHDTIILSDGQLFECKSKEQKKNTFLKIREIILGLKQGDFLESLDELFSNYKIDWFAKNRELCMNWEQIIDLSKDELCTIGCHTVNHYRLNQLSIDEVKFEIIEAKKIIEQKTGKKVEHFAYPFGSKYEVGKREFNIVKSLGFKTATTTRRGNIYYEHKNYLECLPRFMLTENFNLDEITKVRRQRVVTL